MMQIIGKIASVDIINKKVTVEVDKSQIHTINDKYYYPLIYVNPNPNVAVLIIELKKNADQPTFSFQISFQRRALWNDILHCKDHSISFTPNRIFTSPQTQISINDLKELIMI